MHLPAFEYCLECFKRLFPAYENLRYFKGGMCLHPESLKPPQWLTSTSVSPFTFNYVGPQISKPKGRSVPSYGAPCQRHRQEIVYRRKNHTQRFVKPPYATSG
jgi:hypothetical protein